MRTRFLAVLLFVFLQKCLRADAQFQPMGIPTGMYSLAANAATNVPAFCLKLSAESPRAGVNYNSIGHGAQNAHVIATSGRYTIQEALDRGIISITGTEDGYHAQLVFKNNTSEAIRFEVTDDFVIKTSADRYHHFPGIINSGKTQWEIWELMGIAEENWLLQEVNAAVSNRLMSVTFENTGTSIQYVIRNGQQEPIYSGNNFTDIARLTNSGLLHTQYFILKDFPTTDRENAFLRSVQMANRHVPGYKALKPVSENVDFIKPLLQENPNLVRIGSTEPGKYYAHSVKAEVEINREEFEVIAEADKVSVLTTWKNRIRSLFGIRSNNLNDILMSANRTIRQTFPDDNYKVLINDYSVYFTIKRKEQEKQSLAKK